MFKKHISEIAFEDVYQLVQERKTSPNKYLEYQMPGMDTVSYLEDIAGFELYLAQQTSAFANTQGGWLVIGVDTQQPSIPGIAPHINQTPIEDWIAQTLLLQVDFKLPYDIASIAIPDSADEQVVVESGMSQHVAYEERAKHRDETIGIINLTNIVGYQMMLLNFSRSFYELLQYDEEVILQLSFVNVLHYTLYGFHSKYFNSRLYYFYDEYQNKYDPNFKLVEKFHPLELTNEKILEITMRNSEKICRAFGLEQDMAFFEDQIDLTNFSYFDL